VLGPDLGRRQVLADPQRPALTAVSDRDRLVIGPAPGRGQFRAGWNAPAGQQLGQGLRQGLGQGLGHRAHMPILARGRGSVMLRVPGSREPGLLAAADSALAQAAWFVRTVTAD
jgi:hypothetical protein